MTRIEHIGEQTLILGDCREVMQGMGDASIDFIFTDPPYGHNNNNNGDLISRWEAALGSKPVEKSEWRPIANDGHEANEMVRQCFTEFNRLLKPGGCCCCCCGGGGGPDPQFARWSLWIDEAIGFKQMVVWDKGKMGMGWHYRRSYETVLVAQKSGAKCSWHDTSGKIENIIRPGDYGIKKIIPSQDDHPTPKPAELPAHFLKLHSLVGETILDPFFGGGSTLAACEMLGRRGIGIEIDVKHFDSACRRIERIAAQPRLFTEPKQKHKQEAML